MSPPEHSDYIGHSKTPPSYSGAIAHDNHRAVLTIAASDRTLSARDQGITAEISSRAAMHDFCAKNKRTSPDFAFTWGQIMQEFVMHRRTILSIPRHTQSKDATGYAEAYRLVASIARHRSQNEIGTESFSDTSFITTVYDELATRLEAGNSQSAKGDQRLGDAVSSTQLAGSSNGTSSKSSKAVREAFARRNVMLKEYDWLLDDQCSSRDCHPGYRSALMHVFKRAVEGAGDCALSGISLRKDPSELPEHMRTIRSLATIARSLAEEMRKSEKRGQLKAYVPNINSKALDHIARQYDAEISLCEERLANPKAYSFLPVHGRVY